MRLSQQSGFSLIEMLAVVTIFMVLSAISLYAWNAYLPIMQLNEAANAMADTIDLGMIKAVAEQNYWVFFINYNSNNYITTDGLTLYFPANSYVLFDDDGWTGANSRRYNSLTQFGGSQQCFREEYDPNGGNFNVQHRHNMLMERSELFRGPALLEGRVSFIIPSDLKTKVMRIVLRHTDPRMIWQDGFTVSNQPIASGDQHEEPARIRLKDNIYIEGNISRDNLTHRRIVRIDQGGVKVLGA